MKNENENSGSDPILSSLSQGAGAAWPACSHRSPGTGSPSSQDAGDTLSTEDAPGPAAAAQGSAQCSSAPGLPGQRDTVAVAPSSTEHW